MHFAGMDNRATGRCWRWEVVRRGFSRKDKRTAEGLGLVLAAEQRGSFPLIEWRGSGSLEKVLIGKFHGLLLQLNNVYRSLPVSEPGHCRSLPYLHILQFCSVNWSSQACGVSVPMPACMIQGKMTE